MLPLDIPTILFSFIIIDIVGTLLMLLLWVQNRKRISGTFFWVLTFGFQTSAMVMIFTRGVIPDWISFSLSNTLIMAGVLLALLGLERFAGVIRNHMYNYILLVLFTLVQLWFTYYQPNLAVRTLNEGVTMLIISLQCVWLLLVKVDRNMRQLTFGTGVVFIGLSLVNIARIIAFFLIDNEATDYLNSGSFEAGVLICFQILFILLTVSLTLMYNKRLILEIVTGEASLRESHSMLMAAMDCSTSGIAIAAAPGGTIRYVNKAGMFFGVNKDYESESGMDINWYAENLNIKHNDGTSYKSDEVPLSRAVLFGESSSDEFVLTGKDNVARTVICNAAPIKDESGNVKAGIMVFHDITGSKILEQKLKEKIADLEKFNKIMVGRETRMIGLKQEINDLCLKLGLKPRYSVHGS
jgi:PAS domain-containing protein